MNECKAEGEIIGLKEKKGMDGRKEGREMNGWNEWEGREGREMNGWNEWEGREGRGNEWGNGVKGKWDGNGMERE